MAELVKNLGYQTSHGHNYEIVQSRLDKYHISTDHFCQKQNSKRLSDEEIFCKNSEASQSALRKRYLNLEDIDYKCASCGIEPFWNGLPLTLQLDHVDGDNKNNLQDNLRWLCPNCHSQTKTFAGKNSKCLKNVKKYFCVDCGKEISKNAKRCTGCSIKYRAVVESKKPLKEDLVALLNIHNGNFSKVAQIFDVSSNSIRRWCQSYDISYHSFDYKIIKPVKEKRKVQIYPVDQIDKDTGEVIASFKSIKEAERKTGFSHIDTASDPNNTKRKTAGGYLWKRKQSPE